MCCLCVQQLMRHSMIEVYFINLANVQSTYFTICRLPGYISEYFLLMTPCVQVFLGKDEVKCMWLDHVKTHRHATDAFGFLDYIPENSICPKSIMVLISKAINLSNEKYLNT